MSSTTSCWNAFDSIDHFHSFCNLSKYRIAPSHSTRSSKIEKVIINGIDKKLTRCRMWIIRSCHCNGSASIFESIGSFVFNGVMSFFIDHSWFKSSSLNHKTLHNTMKKGSTIKSFCYVSEEVCNRIGSKGIIELKSDSSEICIHSYCFHKKKKRNKSGTSIWGVDFLANKKRARARFLLFCSTRFDILEEIIPCCIICFSCCFTLSSIEVSGIIIIHCILTFVGFWSWLIKSYHCTVHHFLICWLATYVVNSCGGSFFTLSSIEIGSSFLIHCILAFIRFWSWHHLDTCKPFFTGRHWRLCTYIR